MADRRVWTVLVMAVTAFAAAGWAERSVETPDRDAPLHARIEAFDRLVHANHMNERLFMPCVVFPPAGEDRAVTGNHEDVAGHTAMYLAACSHKYVVTQDPAVRTLADEVMDAILRLEKVTGVPGCAARSFYKTDAPLWHENEHFFPMEWHASESMPGYRWEGDLSSDKFVDFIYGVGTYWEFCADAEHQRIAADFIDRFVGRCVDNDFKLVDVDGKMTLWGNFCPHLPHENLNALEMLAGLKVAYKTTGKPRYRAAYEMLIRDYHYDDQAILAKILWPEEWRTPWDDHLAAKSYYMLMRYETDPTLLQKYRMSINRHYHAWKQSALRGTSEVWYIMLYQVLTGEPAVDERVQKAIQDLWAIDRNTQTFTIPTSQGPKQVQSETEEIASDVLRTYWFGRQYGIVPPEW